MSQQEILFQSPSHTIKLLDGFQVIEKHPEVICLPYRFNYETEETDFMLVYESNPLAITGKFWTVVTGTVSENDISYEDCVVNKVYEKTGINMGGFPDDETIDRLKYLGNFMIGKDSYPSNHFFLLDTTDAQLHEAQNKNIKTLWVSEREIMRYAHESEDACIKIMAFYAQTNGLIQYL